MRDFVLRGGVDKITPRSLCEPGSLEDCLNFEVSRDFGYSAIQGFEAFDGHMSPSNRDIWELTVTLASITGTLQANENMTWTLGDDSGDVGVIISATTVSTNKVIRFGYWKTSDRIPSGATITGDTSGASFTLPGAPSLQHLSQVATDQGDYLDQLYAASEVLRSVIRQVPGSGPVSGIKWYKNRQQAIRDLYNFNYDNGDVEEPTEGQHAVIADGNTQAILGDEGIIRAFTVDSGAFETSNAVGTITIDPYQAYFDFDVQLAATYDNVLLPLAELYFTSGSTAVSEGDQLTGQTSTETVTVYRVELQSGTWAGGDAAGRIYCHVMTGVLTDGELLDLVSPSTANVMTLDTVLRNAPGPLVQHVSNNNTTRGEQAGLYLSSRDGWTKVDLGMAIGFDTGTNEPLGVQFGAAAVDQPIQAGTWSDGAGHVSMPNDYWTASSGTVVDAVAASGGAYAYSNVYTGSSPWHRHADRLLIHEFDLSVPAGARLTGIEVEITCKDTTAAALAYLRDITLAFKTGSTDFEDYAGCVAKQQSPGAVATTYTAYTFGGAQDLWGTTINEDNIGDTVLGVAFRAGFYDSGPNTFSVDQVRVRVHYVEQGSVVYFYDTVATADYAQARLVHYHINSGTWTGNDAAGIAYIYELSKSQLPTQNIQIRTGAGGTGDLVGNLVDAESLNTLPGSALVVAQDAKYEMIAENAFANDDFEAIFGVNGADNAFVYDDHYFRPVHTGLSADLDKPRHVELFQFRLWLGYPWGEVDISAAGDPLDFSGVLNAAATGYGRPIHGLARLQGKTMGVFTDQSTFGVTVQGSDFDQQVIAPMKGVIEYSVQDIGTIPLGADTRGIYFLATTDKYGDFETSRSSKMVRPWLLERLQQTAAGLSREKSLVATTVNRLKNQYRMYFADGYRLTMTFFGDDRPPEFTFQKLYTGADQDQFIKVLATDADVDDDGRDRVFFTMDINEDYDHGDDLGYVYEDDRGTSFNGDAIERFIELAPISDGRNYTNSVWAVMHLWGQAHGWAQMLMTTDVDFTHPEDPATTSEDSNYDVAFGASSDTPALEALPFYDKIRLQKRGKLISIRIQNNSDRELPLTLQNITLLDEKQARLEK